MNLASILKQLLDTPGAVGTFKLAVSELALVDAKGKKVNGSRKSIEAAAGTKVNFHPLTIDGATVGDIHNKKILIGLIVDRAAMEAAIEAAERQAAIPKTQESA